MSVHRGIFGANGMLGFAPRFFKIKSARNLLCEPLASKFSGSLFRECPRSVCDVPSLFCKLKNFLLMKCFMPVWSLLHQIPWNF